MWKSWSAGIDRGCRVSALCDSETKSVFVHKYLWGVCVLCVSYCVCNLYQTLQSIGLRFICYLRVRV